MEHNDDRPIGLPPRDEGGLQDPSSGELWQARVVNLIGVFSPASNIAMVWLSPKELRWFGLGAGVLFSLVMLYAWQFAGNETLGWIAAYAHLGLVVLGLIHPRWPEYPARLWIGFGGLLARFMPIPIFAAIYYLVLTPTALFARAMGKDPLRRKAPPGDSYWTEHTPPSKERYERQF